jgi:hypothetical protein
VLSDTVGTVTVGVPFGTSLTNLTAEIDLAAPSINPQPGAATDYSSPVQFTVTPEEGDPRVYTVTAAALPNTEAAIESIDVGDMTGVTRSVDGLTITVSLPNGTDISSIAPTFTLSTGASISPTSGATQNFAAAADNAIAYMVSPAAGAAVTYTVKMKVAADDAKRITKFSVAGVSPAVNALIETTIDDSRDKITVRLPSGLSTMFTPEIQYEGTSLAITPAETSPINFSSDKIYKVTAANSTERNYTVSVSVKNPVAATLNSVVADGASFSLATTHLILNFSHNVTTLTADSILLSPNYTKTSLAKDSGNTWKLGISGVWSQDNPVTVSVSGTPTGYILSGSADAVLNREPITVNFTSLTADGSAGGSNLTTQLQLTFNMEVPGFNIGNVTVEPDPLSSVGSVDKTTHFGTGTPGIYNVGITVLDTDSAADSITVRVTPASAGYDFYPAFREVTVYKKYSTITYNANGGSGSLPANHAAAATHTIGANGGLSMLNMVCKEWNTAADGSGRMFHPGYTYTGSTNITLYAIWITNNHDLMVKFGIKQPSYSSCTPADVTATFNAVAAYLKTKPAKHESGALMTLGAIRLNDYVTLPSLSVSGLTLIGANVIIGDISTSNQKVKVVGINPYTSLNGNGTDPHLVFQFERSLTGSNEYTVPSHTLVNYSASGIRKYLTPQVTDGGNFYNGLVTAGVPPAVFWAPARKIGKKNGDSGVETLSDLVFLPTYYEVSGENGKNANETSSNQGRLSVYQDNDTRKKRNINNNDDKGWWLASPDSTNSDNWCLVNSLGGNSGYSLTGTGVGIAPAFCIKAVP